MAVLSRELDTAREKLRRADARLTALSEACGLAERLAPLITGSFPANHHVCTNRHLLWLCLCDEISQINKDRALLRRVIEDLADQLTDQGIPV